MPHIATLTMNPAIDVSTDTETVEPDRKLRCDESRRDPGGGGINVARVAGRLGAEVSAIYPTGGLTGRLLEKLVSEEGVHSVAVPVRGETREDFTVYDRTADTQYRFVMPGPHLSPHEWRACLHAVRALRTWPDLFCASGSLPPGAPEDFYARVAKTAAASGVKLALDTSGPALRHALEAGVYLLKPNLRELRELTGLGLDDDGARAAACRTLIGRGAAEVVALSLGSEGALLVTAETAWRATAAPIHAVSTVGAGDSFLGGMLWAHSTGAPLHEAFRHGVAAGSATVLSHGTGLGRPEDHHRLLNTVTVVAI